jgi:hypothetical protein
MKIDYEESRIGDKIILAPVAPTATRVSVQVKIGSL